MPLSERELTSLWWSEWNALKALEKEIKDLREKRNRLLDSLYHVVEDLEDFDNKEDHLWNPFGVPNTDDVLIDAHNMYEHLVAEVTSQMDFVTNRMQQSRINLSDYDYQLWNNYKLDTQDFITG